MIMNALILTQLTAANSETAPWSEPYGVRGAVHDEPVSGFIRQIQLGASGVTLHCGGEQVAIPTAALWSLAEKANPRFAPPSAVPAENLKSQIQSPAPAG